MTDTDPSDIRLYRAGTVPSFFTSFVGRKEEIAELQKRLLDAQTRVLTLVGPGGIGKTRLAEQLVRAVETTFEDGYLWIDLSGLDDEALLAVTLHRVLGLPPGDPSSEVDQITRALARRQLLLVFDNCEHLLSAVSDLVETLLDPCDELRILVTSRERLNIPPEVVWQTDPLDVPVLAGGEEALTPEVCRSEAVRLFVDRVNAVTAFDLTAETVGSVIDICRLVDGLPLGLELAAGRCRTFGVRQIADRLSSHIEILSAAHPAGHVRHRSLFGALEWSYELLEQSERVLLARLSVFRGPFSPEAAIAVGAGTAKSGGGNHDIVERLESLVDKSMIQSDEVSPGVRYFRLLDTIRRFAHEKLEDSGGLESAKATHRDFYCNLAEVAGRALRGPEQPRWVRSLQIERDNLREALAYSLEAASLPDSDTTSKALRMAADLFWFWNATDDFREARRWLEAALRLPNQESSVARARASWAAGSVCWLLGDFGAVSKWLGEAMDGYSLAGDTHGVAETTMMKGRLALYRGDSRAATRLLTASVEEYRKSDDRHGLALALTGLGVCLSLEGDTSSGRQTAEEALEIFRSVGDPFFTALALGDLGWVLYLQDDVTLSARYMEESLDLRRQIGSGWLTAQTLNQLAEIERHRGNVESATHLLEESLAIGEDAGAGAWVAAGRRDLGLLMGAEGQHSTAAGLLASALADSVSSGDVLGTATCLEGLSGIAAARGLEQEALLFVTGAQPFRSQAGPPRTPATRADLKRILDQIGPERIRTSSAPVMGADELLELSEQLARLTETSMTIRSSNQIRVVALGPTEVYRAGELVRAGDWTYAKPKELLFYLMEADPRSKEEIGLVFWPDASSTQLRRNLRSALYHARRALGARDWIVFKDGRYAFNRNLDYWYDVEEFERLIEEARRDSTDDQTAAVTVLGKAIVLYRGDFVGDLASDVWAAARREELRGMCLEAMLMKGSLLDAMGEHDEAANSYRDALRVNPLSDEAHLGLIRSYASRDDRAGALRHYSELVLLYEVELGTTPREDIQRLAKALRGGED